MCKKEKHMKTSETEPNKVLLLYQPDRELKVTVMDKHDTQTK